MRRKAQFAGFVCEGTLALAVVALFHMDPSVDSTIPEPAPSQDITRLRTSEAAETTHREETTTAVRVPHDETTPQAIEQASPSCRDRFCRWLRKAIDWLP